MEVLEEKAIWEQHSPRVAHLPEFGREDDGRLYVEGGGNKASFGYHCRTVPVTGGAYYTFTVEFTVQNCEDVNLHVMNLLMWKGKTLSGVGCPHDMITNFTRRGEKIVGCQKFRAPREADAVEIQLGLRYSADARVCWSRVALEEAEPPEKRPVRVAAMRWNSNACADLKACEAEMERLADEAGGRNCDLLLFPEFSYCAYMLPCSAYAVHVPDSDVCRLLARKAKQYGMYICAGLAEEEDGLLYNTTVVFDRQGNFIGKYRKVHLYWPECIHYGETPGDQLPVFDLDFGRVGIMTCYDSWYAETARLLSLKGAEMILFPNAGYEELIMPARAIDNGVYLVISALGGTGAVYNTLGRITASTTGGLAIADLDLSEHPLPHANAGGNLNSSPGGKRGMRNSVSNFVYQEILEEIQKHEDRPTAYTWVY